MSLYDFDADDYEAHLANKQWFERQKTAPTVPDYMRSKRFGGKSADSRAPEPKPGSWK
jgi:hypothetical protein